MTGGQISSFTSLAKEHQHYTQEAPLKLKEDKKSYKIGVPKEKDPNEKRTAFTPNAVALLVNNGCEVILESGAGLDANYTDRQYSEAGAQICYSTREVYQNEVVVKIDPPSVEEIGYMPKQSCLISALQLPKLTEAHIHALNKKQIIAFGFELMEDKTGNMPIVRSMSEIAGCCIMSIAAEHLSNLNDGMGIILGGITGTPPTNMVVLGAGTVAEYVIRAARGLGTAIKVFDRHHYKLRRLKNILGGEIYTSIIEPTILANELESADVVVCALRSDEEGVGYCVVNEEMVINMKHGAVVIDANISEGGCFETSQLTSHKHPIHELHGVKHYCVPNIPSRVARTATRAFSNLLAPFILKMCEHKTIIDMVQSSPWLSKGIYCYHGHLTKKGLGKRFFLPSKEIDLLMAPGM